MRMKKPAGFTLIEVLAAMSLTVVILVTVVLVIRSEIGLSRVLAETDRSWSTVRTLTAMITTQMASATGLTGDDFVPFIGKDRETTFLTNLSRSGPTPQGRGVVEATYRFEEERGFVYRERFLPLIEVPGWDQPQTYEGILSPLVAGMSLSYLDHNGENYSEWPPDNRDAPLLPEAVLISLEITGVADPIDFTVRINQ